MVIAETAVVIPVLGLVALALAWGVSLTGSAMSLADAARNVARDVARGVAVGEALQAAQEQVPEATITVEGDGSMVSVVVHRDVAAPLPGLSFWVIPMEQSVTMPREWS